MHLNQLLKSKPLVLIISLFLINTLFLSPVKAVNLSPNSGSLSGSTTHAINITASPSGTSSAVQIRLTFTGATVTGYTAPTTNWAPALGDCSGGVTFTSNSICVSLAKSSGNITTGESLGSFTIYTASSGSVTITRGSENGYLVSSSIVPQTGSAATFTIGATTLPNTAALTTYVLGTLGILLIIFGASLKINKTHSDEQKN